MRHPPPGGLILSTRADAERLHDQLSIPHAYHHHCSRKTRPDAPSHLVSVNIDDITYYFSYQTLIGFEDGYSGEKVLAKNQWSCTTGKHINYLWSEGDELVPYNELLERLEWIKNERGTQLAVR